MATPNTRQNLQIGRTFAPPTVPPPFSAPLPFLATVELRSTVDEGDFQIRGIDLVFAQLEKTLGLAGPTISTSSFSFAFRSVDMWMVPPTTGSSTVPSGWGQLTAQFLDPTNADRDVLRQVQSYGSLDRAARIGFQYPRRIMEQPLANSDAANGWIRVKHDSDEAGAYKLIVRVTGTVVLFGSDV